MKTLEDEWYVVICLPIFLCCHVLRVHAIPTLESTDSMIMENLSVHHVRKVLDLVHQAGILVMFLPPYSPDVNPMEEAFSYIKSYLRKHDELLRAVPNPQDIIRLAFYSITAKPCQSWIYHSGYNTCY